MLGKGQCQQAQHDGHVRKPRRLSAPLPLARAHLPGSTDRREGQAAEIIWALNHPSVYYLLVHEHGWAEARFEHWLTDALIRQLLT